MSMNIKTEQKQGLAGCHVSTAFNMVMGALSLLAGGGLVWLVYTWL